MDLENRENSSLVARDVQDGRRESYHRGVRLILMISVIRAFEFSVVHVFSLPPLRRVVQPSGIPLL